MTARVRLSAAAVLVLGLIVAGFRLGVGSGRVRDDGSGVDAPADVAGVAPAGLAPRPRSPDATIAAPPASALGDATVEVRAADAAISAASLELFAADGRPFLAQRIPVGRPVTVSGLDGGRFAVRVSAGVDLVATGFVHRGERVTLLLASGRGIRVRTVGPDGRPVGPCLLESFVDLGRGRVPLGVTDAEGRGAVLVEGDGARRIVASHPRFGLGFAAVPPAAPPADVEIRVGVEGARPVGLELRDDTDGSPLATATVTWEFGGGRWTTAMPGIGGWIAWPPAPGTRLCVRAPEFLDRWIPPDDVGDRVVVRLRRAPRLARIRVVDALGVAVGGASVRVLVTTPPPASDTGVARLGHAEEIAALTTDGEGTARVPVPEAGCTVVVAARGSAPTIVAIDAADPAEERRVVVGPGRSVRVRLAPNCLAPDVDVWVRLTVRDRHGAEAWETTAAVFGGEAVLSDVPAGDVRWAVSAGPEADELAPEAPLVSDTCDVDCPNETGVGPIRLAMHPLFEGTAVAFRALSGAGVAASDPAAVVRCEHGEAVVRSLRSGSYEARPTWPPGAPAVRVLAGAPPRPTTYADGEVPAPLRRWRVAVVDETSGDAVPSAVVHVEAEGRTFFRVQTADAVDLLVGAGHTRYRVSADGFVVRTGELDPGSLPATLRLQRAQETLISLEGWQEGEVRFWLFGAQGERIVGSATSDVLRVPLDPRVDYIGLATSATASYGPSLVRGGRPATLLGAAAGDVEVSLPDTSGRAAGLSLESQAFHVSRTTSSNEWAPPGSVAFAMVAGADRPRGTTARFERLPPGAYVVRLRIVGAADEVTRTIQVAPGARASVDLRAP